jgi:hypothetical protein
MTIVRLIPNTLISSTGWDAEGPVTVAKLSTDDGGTTAVYSPTSNDVFRFSVDASPVPSGSTIASVTVGAKILKLDPVDALTRNQLYIGGNTYEAGNFSPSTNAVYETATYQLTSNPSNGQPWTTADLAAMNIGVRKENSAGERATFLFADVDYTGGAALVVARASTNLMMGV